MLAFAALVACCQGRAPQKNGSLVAPPAETPQQDPALRELLNELEQSSEEARSYIIEKLKKLDTCEARHQLRWLVEFHENQMVRERALASLIDIDDPGAIRIAKARLEDCRSLHQPSIYLIYLMIMEDPSASDCVRLWLSEPGRETGLLLIRLTRYAPALPWVAPLLDSDDPGIRQAAAWALSSMESSATAEVLFDFIRKYSGSKEDRTAVSIAIHGLHTGREGETLRRLEQILDPVFADDVDEVRTKFFAKAGRAEAWDLMPNRSALGYLSAPDVMRVLDTVRVPGTLLSGTFGEMVATLKAKLPVPVIVTAGAEGLMSCRYDPITFMELGYRPTATEMLDCRYLGGGCEQHAWGASQAGVAIMLASEENAFWREQKAAWEERQKEKGR